MNKQQRKEAITVTLELQKLYNEFANRVNVFDDVLLQDEHTYSVYKAFHESWKYKVDKWKLRFKSVVPDKYAFHNLVTQMILSEYYNVEVSIKEIGANFSNHPNETAVKIVCKT